ncbi:MAG: hypothetical protein J6I32_04965 [Bacteroidaceae bacterium]|nr:hypothetical protein [Bacteroidaceae bacterium]
MKKLHSIELAANCIALLAPIRLVVCLAERLAALLSVSSAPFCGCISPAGNP